MRTQFRPGGAMTSATTTGNRASRTIGKMRETRSEPTFSRGENATMNVRRYIASGSIQRNGAAARFEVMWLVTASINPDAMKAVRIQNNLVLKAGRGSESIGLRDRDALPALRQTIPAVIVISAIRNPYPVDQIVL